LIELCLASLLFLKCCGISLIRSKPQDELAGTENRIERPKYNETVQFPNNIAASMSSFQRNEAYFKTEPGAHNAPKVSC